MSDHLEDMIRDVGEDNFGRANLYDSLINDSEQPLFPGCSNFTRLSATLKLFSLKARNGWTNKSFTELLELLKEMLPENNTYLFVIMRQNLFYVQWVLNIKRYMLVLMILFCTQGSLLR
ncbi:hypothetical protein VIGAN_07121500 [Vigna angularis var. angularis]|uniref:Uncharacterized protein n=1 Tax=Vigna angularis var. angularis TaxID=157739 RepID=A0A0S3SI04_PHAAN|nr:hypothetical protein VIGAN_07121500 [Vigna angularis var. angularis]